MERVFIVSSGHEMLCTFQNRSLFFFFLKTPHKRMLLRIHFITVWMESNSLKNQFPMNTYCNNNNNNQKYDPYASCTLYVSLNWVYILLIKSVMYTKTVILYSYTHLIYFFTFNVSIHFSVRWSINFSIITRKYHNNQLNYLISLYKYINVFFFFIFCEMQSLFESIQNAISIIFKYHISSLSIRSFVCIFQCIIVKVSCVYIDSLNRYIHAKQKPIIQHCNYFDMCFCSSLAGFTIQFTRFIFWSLWQFYKISINIEHIFIVMNWYHYQFYDANSNIANEFIINIWYFIFNSMFYTKSVIKYIDFVFDNLSI